MFRGLNIPLEMESARVVTKVKFFYFPMVENEQESQCGGCACAWLIRGDKAGGGSEAHGVTSDSSKLVEVLRNSLLHTRKGCTLYLVDLSRRCDTSLWAS